MNTNKLLLLFLLLLSEPESLLIMTRIISGARILYASHISISKTKGPPLTTEVVGARRLSRIKTATRKGRNPRLRLAFKHAYCSPTAAAAAACRVEIRAVSYTHLTLPTIYPV